MREKENKAPKLVTRRRLMLLGLAAVALTGCEPVLDKDDIRSPISSATLLWERVEKYFSDRIKRRVTHPSGAPYRY